MLAGYDMQIVISISSMTVLVFQVCVICAAGEHGGHDLTDINKNADKKRDHLTTWSKDFSVTAWFI